jgi:hypothetical protein
MKRPKREAAMIPGYYTIPWRIRPFLLRLARALNSHFQRKIYGWKRFIDRLTVNFPADASGGPTCERIHLTSIVAESPVATGMIPLAGRVATLNSM